MAYQSIVPALMLRSNCAWRVHKLPENARPKNKKARNYAGLVAFYAIRCLTVPDAESLPLNRRRRLTRNIVDHTVNPAHFVDDAVGYPG